MQTKPANWALVFVSLRWYFLALFCALTITAVQYARFLTFNFSPDNLYLATDPAYEFYKNKFLPEFGQSANYCIIAVDGDLAQPHVQKALKDLHNEVKKIAELENVHSLVDMSIYRIVDGVHQAVPVFGQAGDVTRETLHWVSGDPAMQNLLISKEGNIATISVRLPLKLADEKSATAIVYKLQTAIAAVKKNYPDLSFYLAGSPVLQHEAIDTLKRDQIRFLPLTVILMALLLWLSFHSLRGVFLPFIATGAAALWAMGWLGMIEHPLDIINNKLAVLLLVVGISSAVQMFARFQDELKRARQSAGPDRPPNRDEIVASCVQRLALPCLLTTAIAALGFGAVAISEVTIIRNFGLDAAVGIMGSYISTMLFVPAMLRILPLPREKRQNHRRNWLSMDKLLGIIARFSMANPRVIVVSALVTLCVGSYLAKDMHADQKFTSELPQGAETLMSLKFIEKHLTGVMPFEVVFEGTPQRLVQPDIVRLGAVLEEAMASDPLKPTTRSFAGVLRSIDRSFSEDGNVKSGADYDDAEIAQLLLTLESGGTQAEEAKRDFFSQDGKFYRVQGLIKDANTTEVGEFRDRIIRKIEAIQSATPSLRDIKIHLTGAAMISTNALDHIITSTIASLGVAILSIFILVLVLLRSLRFAFIALLPNLVPIAVTLSFMQVFGVSLRVATVLIFSMALGIAVDACVYLITRFREEMLHHHIDVNDKNVGVLHTIIERTMRGSGRPVVYTTLMLLAGFSALSISKFAALRDFAVLSSITLVTALIVDLLLWPALVVLIKPKLKFAKKTAESR